MAFGDAIAEGYGSIDYNGYRMVLYNHLKTDCGRRKVEFVGSQKGGAEPVTDHEGHHGADIESLLALCSGEDVTSTLAKNPNVILLHIGTENMSPLRSPDIAGPEEAPAKLGELVDHIFSIAPNVVLVVAQIIWSPNFVWFDNIDPYNAAITRMVKRKADQGRKILTADLRPIGEKDCIRNFDGTWQECADLNNDGLHPKDEGYRRAAGFWYEALFEATQKGWLR
ncbi:hypothetical protein PRZ48_013761 [Zasmidium cellare]|uniref:SGNH hydrolase-type esterase domain-containing protein n=1 Tax=Zasmidium cellare TaxID=395010 RepID=A0ABR0E2C1_ZASCE|nr:hypothetical protein PRZ48_013761 [Zasmidium cellare]